jgi:hypothetical protein
MKKTLPAAEAVPVFQKWSERFDSAAASANDVELLRIGREMFDWLAEMGLLDALRERTGDRELVLAVDRQGDPLAETALFDAPWELLATDAGHLAENGMQLFVTSRRVAQDGPPREPAFCDLRLMFMAASPDGVVELDYEEEEAAILDATKSGERVQLLVEETGALDFLANRLASEEGPFEVLHLSCHGGIDPERGPVLMLETAAGEPTLVRPPDLFRALPSGNQPLLVALSACRTAEVRLHGRGNRDASIHTAKDGELKRDARTGPVTDSVKFMASFARQLTTQVANVLAWDGSVHDHDATSFAKEFYKLLGRGETVPRAAAMARSELLKHLRQGAQDSTKGKHWHLARVYVGPGGGGRICDSKTETWHKPLPPDSDQIWLDKENRKVRVAARPAFVGRRRVIQSVLRAFRDGKGLGRAVLVLGSGGLGKSSLAARVAGRATTLRTVVIVDTYDALSVFETVLKMVDPVTRSDASWDDWREKIREEEGKLAFALEELLVGPLEDAPILLIVDDLERILKLPVADQAQRVVSGDNHRKALGSILTAFATPGISSRLLLTSRYDFQLLDEKGADLAAGLTRVSLGPMRERERTKQLRRALAVAGVDMAKGDELQLLGRAVGAANGNPGLQAALTKFVLQGDHEDAETALGHIERYRQTEVLPHWIQTLVDQGAEDDGDQAIVAYYMQLAFDRYWSARPSNGAQPSGT